MTCTVCHRASRSCDYAGCPHPVRRETRRQPAPRNGSMWLWLLVYFAVLLGLALLVRPVRAQDFPPPAPAPQQQKCGKRVEVIYRLANQYLESQIVLWLAPDGSLMEVWGNPKTGTSTLLRTPGPDKPTCMVDAGQGFQIFPYAPGDDA